MMLDTEANTNPMEVFVRCGRCGDVYAQRSVAVNSDLSERITLVYHALKDAEAKHGLHKCRPPAVEPAHERPHTKQRSGTPLYDCTTADWWPAVMEQLIVKPYKNRQGKEARLEFPRAIPAEFEAILCPCCACGRTMNPVHQRVSRGKSRSFHFRVTCGDRSCANGGRSATMHRRIKAKKLGLDPSSLEN